MNPLPLPIHPFDLVVARTIAAPAELPIGIITAILGAPVFLMLLLGRQGRQAMEGL